MGRLWHLPWAMPASLCPDKAFPLPLGRGRVGEGATKGASRAVPGAHATPSQPACSAHIPLLPLGRSSGAPGTVAMAAALGKLQLGNYCEHPSCLLPVESAG